MARRLSEAKVRAIQRAADAGTLTLRELAAEFGVSYRALWLAVTNVARSTPRPGDQFPGDAAERGERGHGQNMGENQPPQDWQDARKLGSELAGCLGPLLGFALDTYTAQATNADTGRAIEFSDCPHPEERCREVASDQEQADRQGRATRCRWGS